MAAANPVGVGIVGAGFISSIYLENLTARFDNVRVVGLADLMMDRARDQAAKFGVEAMTVDELLDHPEIEIIVNLTIPAAHAEVGVQAIESGKSIYSEKPRATTPAEAQKLLARAQARGVRVGAAPDPFLGGGLQTVRALLDEGAIGRPLAATGMMLTAGHEHWHPNPDFYYQAGGGPLWDMGPYYLTALLALLGPVERVAATASTSFGTRTINSGPRAGETVPVDTPTHILTLLDFASDARGNLTTSFDVHDTRGSTLVLYGSEGTLRLPDPNTFGGPIERLARGAETWEDIPLRFGFADNSRGLGVSDMARGLREDEPHRASGEMAAHAVDIMAAAMTSSDEGRHIAVSSTFDRPAPLY